MKLRVPRGLRRLFLLLMALGVAGFTLATAGSGLTRAGERDHVVAQGAARHPTPTPSANPRVRLVQERALPIVGGDDDYDALIELVGDARFVLLGEETHGTH